MDHQTTVLIADSSEEFCGALTSALQRADGFQVVGTAGDGEQAIRLIQERKPEVLVLDFAGVTFMDSSGIGLIMGRHRSMESIGGEVIVRNPPQHIRRVMRLSGMERIARIQMDAPAAQPEEPAERRDEQ